MKQLLCILPLLFCFQSVCAQDQPSESISIGKKYQLHSSILDQQREIWVATPRGYDPAQKATFPVIYVFDGESLFPAVAGAVRFMSYSSEIPPIPEAIVVGVTNVDRGRDMPIPQRYFRDFGEENFRAFMTEELVPYINNKYQTNGLNILIGHSQGGLFSSYLFAKDHEMFPFVIALDDPIGIFPSFNSIRQEIGQVLQVNPATRYASFEAVYGWSDQWEPAIQTEDRALQAMVTGETHESMPYKSIYDGLKFLFNDFSPPRNDMKLNLLTEHYAMLSEKYGYVTDIPQKVLLASAGRKIVENRKKEIIELLDFTDNHFGKSDRSASIREQAAGITKEPDPMVDYYLYGMEGPDRNAARKFAGHWKGTIIPERGMTMKYEFKITEENSELSFIGKFGYMDDFQMIPDFFSVQGDTLIWGRKNRGGGAWVSKGVINDSGILTGTESLIGIEPPRADMKLPAPNTFRFERLIR